MIVLRRSAKTVRAMVWAFFTLWFSASPISSADPAPINIALRSAASSQGQVVRVRDIANVYAENIGLREKISKLDVADPLNAGESSRLTRSQVSIRLMLAGMSPDDFRITGADVVNVSYDSEVAISDEMVLASVRNALAEQLEMPANDIHLTLLSPIRLNSTYESFSLDEVRLETRLPSNLWTKTLNAQVGIHARGRLREVVAVPLEIRIDFKVPKTRRDVKAGETFTTANLGYEPTLIDADVVRRLEKDVVGKRAVRDLRAGEIVERNHVTSSNQVRREILVRQREAVQVVARRGSLVVKTQKAVALDSGRLGDDIRLQNTDTGRIIRGRVAKRWTVEVPF